MRIGERGFSKTVDGETSVYSCDNEPEIQFFENNTETVYPIPARGGHTVGNNVDEYMDDFDYNGMEEMDVNQKEGAVLFFMNNENVDEYNQEKNEVGTANVFESPNNDTVAEDEEVVTHAVKLQAVFRGYSSRKLVENHRVMQSLIDETYQHQQECERQLEENTNRVEELTQELEVCRIKYYEMDEQKEQLKKKITAFIESFKTTQGREPTLLEKKSGIGSDYDLLWKLQDGLKKLGGQIEQLELQVEDRTSKKEMLVERVHMLQGDIRHYQQGGKKIERELDLRDAPHKLINAHTSSKATVESIPERKESGANIGTAVTAEEWKNLKRNSKDLLGIWIRQQMRKLKICSTGMNKRIVGYNKHSNI